MKPFIQEWLEEHTNLFNDAIIHVKEQVSDGYSVDGAVEHTSNLFGIARSALDYELELRSY